MISLWHTYSKHYNKYANQGRSHKVSMKIVWEVWWKVGEWRPSMTMWRRERKEGEASLHGNVDSNEATIPMSPMSRDQ